MFTGVGKTSTVTRYIQKTFIQTKTPTIGASFFSCKVKVGDVGVKLQVYFQYSSYTTVRYKILDLGYSWTRKV